MFETINAMFLGDVINSLDPKYVEQIESAKAKTFVYSNMYEFPEYYRFLSSRKNKNYHLDERLLNTKGLETYEFIKTFIHEHDYDPECIMMLYGLISTKVLKKYVDAYTKEMVRTFVPSKKMKELKEAKVLSCIECMFFKEKTGRNLYQTKPLKDVDLLFNDKAKLCYQELMSNVYLFKLGYTVYKKSIKTFRKVSNYVFPNFLGLPRLFMSIANVFVRNKKYKLSYMAKPHFVNPLVDYLNDKNKEWNLDGKAVNYSFNKLYEIAKEESVKLLSMVSEDIFYKKTNNKAIKQIEAL